jgi:two-component system, NarL family, nitrate/nitrite response regulator NarL
MAEPRQPIRVVLVDDHALFRESVARFLMNDPGFQVVDHCGSIEKALEILQTREVDVVLLDFDLGGGDGSQLIRLAQHRGFNGKVLVVTAGVADHHAADLIRMGVAGIFMKHESAALLAKGIRDVMAGKVWFDQRLLRGAVARTGRDADRAGQFTRRERQVLGFVLEGLANKQIAGRLGVSESAVKATLQQLFSKTGVRTRSQLVRITLEQYPELAVGARE